MMIMIIMIMVIMVMIMVIIIILMLMIIIMVHPPVGSQYQRTGASLNPGLNTKPGGGRTRQHWFRSGTRKEAGLTHVPQITHPVRAQLSKMAHTKLPANLQFAIRNPVRPYINNNINNNNNNSK